MTSERTATDSEASLRSMATEEQRIKYERFFPGDDSLIGVRMGDVFNLARTALSMPVAELEALLESSTHEVRVGACSIMGKSATAKKVTSDRRQELYELYLRRHDRINTWDLVDLGAHQVLGHWLLDKPRTPLYDLARSDFWPERRSAIVATAAYLRRDETDDTLRIAALLADDGEEFVQKGVGWMLRYVGDVDRARLLVHLDEYAEKMSRTAVRAAIEKLDRPTRERYLERP
ncbi:DNA alkylation repair protein [Arthrobacter ruber]|uniref:DNA alkylation repair protein n=1 Tax=Arthrobacter ruber TaxID=1258893 RepID=UPI000CF4A97B|nr:DNA alkylation repair protein [Arthrobacter ruber]